MTPLRDDFLCFTVRRFWVDVGRLRTQLSFGIPCEVGVTRNPYQGNAVGFSKSVKDFMTESEAKILDNRARYRT